MLQKYLCIEPPFEPAQQIAEAAVAIAFRMDLPVFRPEDHHRDAQALQFARQIRPVRLDPPPLAWRNSGAAETLAFKSGVGDVDRQ